MEGDRSQIRVARQNWQPSRKVWDMGTIVSMLYWYATKPVCVWGGGELKLCHCAKVGLPGAIIALAGRAFLGVGGVYTM